MPRNPRAVAEAFLGAGHSHRAHLLGIRSANAPISLGVDDNSRCCDDCHDVRSCAGGASTQPFAATHEQIAGSHKFTLTCNDAGRECQNRRPTRSTQAQPSPRRSRHADRAALNDDASTDGTSSEKVPLAVPAGGALGQHTGSPKKPAPEDPSPTDPTPTDGGDGTTTTGTGTTDDDEKDSVFDEILDVLSTLFGGGGSGPGPDWAGWTGGTRGGTTGGGDGGDEKAPTKPTGGTIAGAPPTGGSDEPPWGWGGGGPYWGGGDDTPQSESQCDYAENCTKEQCEALYTAQLNICAQPHSCSASMECSVLRVSGIWGHLCAMARSELALACWGTFTDQGHRTAYDNELRSIRKCRNFYTAAGCGDWPLKQLPWSNEF
jgi:hypothetical protein